MQILREAFPSIGQPDKTLENSHWRAALQVQRVRPILQHLLQSPTARQKHPQQRATGGRRAGGLADQDNPVYGDGGGGEEEEA